MGPDQGMYGNPETDPISQTGRLGSGSTSLRARPGRIKLAVSSGLDSRVFRLPSANTVEQLTAQKDVLDGSTRFWRKYLDGRLEPTPQATAD